MYKHPQILGKKLRRKHPPPVQYQRGRDVSSDDVRTGVHRTVTAPPMLLIGLTGLTGLAGSSDAHRCRDADAQSPLPPGCVGLSDALSSGVRGAAEISTSFPVDQTYFPGNSTGGECTASSARNRPMSVLPAAKKPTARQGYL